MIRSLSLALVLTFTGLVPLQAADNLTVDQPFVRAVPPGMKNSAAFMQIQNSGKEDRALVSATSPAAKVVELHTHTMENGMMKMRRVEQIEVPAGKTVELKPGGLHVMLIDLTGPLAEGRSVDLTLTLDNGDKLEVSAPVKKVEAPKGMSMSHDHH